MRKPGDILREILKEKGIERVGTLSRKWPSGEDIFQELALLLLEGDGAIVKLQEPTAESWDLSGKKRGPSIYAYVRPCMVEKFEVVISREDLMRRLPDYPWIIIDLMFWHKHIPKEKGKVSLQLRETYAVARRMFWPRRVAITWVNEEFRKMAKLPLEKVEASPVPTAEFLRSRGIKRVVLLDPNAPEVLSKEDLKEKAFIIGGIVDMKGDKKGTTAKIGESLESQGIEVLRRKIVLRGDVVGVPDRINHIAEILIRMLYGEDMEKAVLAVQAPTHARWRLRKEIPKRKIRYLIDGKLYLVVEKELYDELKEWLNIRWEDFVKVLRETGMVALERKRIHHLNKISVYRFDRSGGKRVILLKRVALLCYNC
ncbi:tRNA (guanine(9)-/adenine(9)-N1)-methyltransferase [Pyrococcus sp. ST04]|uniref:tRNA (guanine(9)-/adenine(9)-N1)-methyltransferase n=1 Tax=Pyrococcus sp. ST04 TaxID=1183377 RepID=UPI00064ED578|nr:tRNA (guanine(9)-/adenine(9)-N1)-methyltransferase [Pyrococcus sp. ST04]